MSNKEVTKVLADIIKTEMSIPNERIMIYNQKWNLPNDKDIFIYLGYVSENIIMNKTAYEDREGDGFYEVQTLSVSQVISINIFSRDDTARTRKEEILMALKSTYAQQKSEEQSIKIARIPTTFTDLSNLEASAMLNRYNINIQVFSSFTKEKTVEYYDKFSVQTLKSL